MVSWSGKNGQKLSLKLPKFNFFKFRPKSQTFRTKTDSPTWKRWYNSKVKITIKEKQLKDNMKRKEANILRILCLRQDKVSTNRQRLVFMQHLIEG